MSNEECISMYTSTFMFLIDRLESVGGLMNTQDYPAIIYSLSSPSLLYPFYLLALSWYCTVDILSLFCMVIYFKISFSYCS